MTILLFSADRFCEPPYRFYGTIRSGNGFVSTGFGAMLRDAVPMACLEQARHLIDQLPPLPAGRSYYLATRNDPWKYWTDTTFATLPTPA